MTATAQAARGKKIKTDPPRGRVSDLHAPAARTLGLNLARAADTRWRVSARARFQMAVGAASAGTETRPPRQPSAERAARQARISEREATASADQQAAQSAEAQAAWYRGGGGVISEAEAERQRLAEVDARRVAATVSDFGPGMTNSADFGESVRETTAWAYGLAATEPSGDEGEFGEFHRVGPNCATWPSVLTENPC